jgi:pimeloyl-CoA synthetase
MGGGDGGGFDETKEVKCRKEREKIEKAAESTTMTALSKPSDASWDVETRFTGQRMAVCGARGCPACENLDWKEEEQGRPTNNDEERRRCAEAVELAFVDSTECFSSQ